MLTLKLLSWFIVIGINIYADRNGRKPNYLVMFVLRAFAAIVHGSMFTSSYLGWWWSWWPVLSFQITSYWIFFELGLNIVRKKPLLYYDNKEGDSGWIDRFFKWIGPEVRFACKVIVFLLMVSSLIICYQRYGYNA